MSGSIAITGDLGSALARVCDVALDASVREEACPHDLAPTTSTTVALALGDALAVTLLEQKGFTREDFATLHPGGSIGRQLLTNVEGVMQRDNLPVLHKGDTMRDAIVLLAERRGIAIMVDDGDRVTGVMTAGDLTRAMENGDDVRQLPVERILNRSPKVARHDDLASAVVYRHGKTRHHVHARARRGRPARRRRAPPRLDAGASRMKGFLIAVVALAVAGCSKTTQPPSARATLADTAEQVMYDVHTMLTNSGVKRGDMYADTVYVFDEQTRFVMLRVRATFNTETGAPNGTLRGDRGNYKFREKLLEGFGNVVVTSTDGRRLNSNHLKYSQLSNEISSDSAFTLTQLDRVQRGIGFTSDPNVTVFRCHRACSGSANVPLGELKP